VLLASGAKTTGAFSAAPFMLYNQISAGGIVRQSTGHQRIQPVISNKSNRRQPHPFNKIIERMFGRLKDFRRVATRYDKNADNFLAALCIAALIYLWI